MESLKNYIFRQVEENKLSPNDAKKLLMELKGGTPRTDDDIAVIGMSCKFPGSNNVDQYWEVLRNGLNCIASFPKERRKDGQVFYKLPHLYEIMSGGGVEITEETDFDGDIYIKGGYLDEVDKFDAGFFRIPPREAKHMDPAQRVFLETAWESVEDAGYGGNKIYGTKTGVFVGCDHTNISLYKYITEPDQMSLTGSWAGILATRISYIFNLRGAGMVIDTACSSGLTSIHEACLAIKNKECDMALAGGINLSVVPGLTGSSSAMDMVESDDFLVRTFDNKANGTVWGEGVGVLFLKPLDKAMADGDHIHAVIKGSAINNDGASNGITAPNADAQEEVILHAWKDAGINPETVSYIEAHGTGTVLGDPIEIKGLTNAFKRHTNKRQFCGIGSVKTNFGHLVAASGVASAIKVILALKNKTLPPTINFKEPNQYIDFNASPVYVNDRLNPWEKDSAPRRAGVNSFGFSGTNCHVVLEEAPEIPKTGNTGEGSPRILTLSARSEKVLADFVDRYVDYVNRNLDSDVDGICYTANTGRGHFTCRLALVVKDYADLKDKILKLERSGLKSLPEEGIFYREHKVVAENKKALEENEVKESQKREFTKAAGTLVKAGKKDEGSIGELCRLYVQGAEVEWEEYYKGQKLRRVSVPVYPLERVYFWGEPKTIKNSAAQNEYTKDISHPLIDKCLADSVDRQTYCTRFRLDRHWVLSDHRVMGNYVVPGTTYLEMARKACSELYGGEPVELRDIMFISPLIVNEGESKEVQTILKKEDGYTGIVIASKIVSDDPDKDRKWIIHVEGKACKNADKEIVRYDIEALKARCNKRESSVNLADAQGGFSFGPRWMNVDKVLAGENEAIFKLKLPVELRGDIEEYDIHPALMDNAVNTVSQGIGEGMYLPLSYGSLKIYGKMPHTFYSYVRRKDKQTGNLETIICDISLIDEAGKRFIEIEDYTIKKVHAAELKFKELSGKSNTYYEIGWIPAEMVPSEQKTTEGPVLVFKDASGIAEAIMKKLKDRGRETLEVAIGGMEEDYRRLLEEIKLLKPAQIIHVTEPEESQVKGLYSLLYLTKGLVANNFNEELDIVLVADNAYAVTKEEDKIHPQHAALFGLSKVVTQEYPQLKCRCVDIDTATGADAIIEELNARGTVYPVAYRKGKRYAAEFRRLEVKAAGELTIREDGVYIITGGTGGLGLEMAKYLAANARTKLALINRSKMPDRGSWDELLQKGEDKKLCSRIQTVRAMEETGTTVEIYSADVADEAEMKALIEDLRAKYGKINGIIHSAGVAGDGFIVRKDEKIFKSVISSKIQGTWVLHKVTEQDEMDFFVLFSSMATLTGGPGQGDYTAANSYLDSFAAYRSRQGKRTLAINWPSWKETGMAVDFGVDDSNTVFKSLTTVKALEIFQELLNSDVVRAYPGELNYRLVSALKGQFPVLLSRQVNAAVEKYAAKNQPAGGSTDVREPITEVIIRGAGADGLSDTEMKLAHIWAQTLGLKEVDIYENFHDLGGDSILATQLLKEIDKVYPGVISISDIFSYPSVAELANFLDGAVQKTEEVPQPGTGQKIVTGEVKLLPAQKAFFDEGYTDMHHWNAAEMLYSVMGFDERVLPMVLDKVVEHHDSLRMVFKFEEGRVVQYNRGMEGELYDLKVFDFTGEANPIDRIKEEVRKVHTGIDLSNGPLLKMALFKTSQGDHLLIVMHHLITDGTSMQLMIGDAINAYAQAVMGQEIQLPPKTDSLMRYAEKLYAYAGSNELKKEVEYWQKIENVPVAVLPRDHKVAENRIKDSRTIKATLLQEGETKKLLRVPILAGGIEIIAVLLAAWGMTVKEWTGEDKVLVQMLTHGRNLPFEGVNLSRTVGWISTAYPLLLDLEESVNISRQLEVIEAAFRGVPGNGIGYGFMETIAPVEIASGLKLSLKPEISFNFSGVIDAPDAGAAQLVTVSPISAGITMSLETERRHAFIIDLNIAEGCLKLKINFNRYEYDESTVQYLIDGFGKNIKRIIGFYTGE